LKSPQKSPVEKFSVIKAEQLKTACSSCNLRELCLPIGLSEGDMVKIDQLIQNRRSIKKGESLIRQGDHFSSVYAVRVGFFKTIVNTDDGRDQITGFQMSGDVIGLDGIQTDLHTCEAMAIEDSEVCVIPMERLEEIARNIPALQHHFHKIMSREIVRENEQILLLGSMRSEERLASFLLNLSNRLKSRGFSQSEMILRMTREEIGSYLGLKLETVSRTFSKFSEEGLISVQQKAVLILDTKGLSLKAKATLIE
jgi:CRP/FNR family transcriptional regulator, anaerobic regulatory protein